MSLSDLAPRRRWLVPAATGLLILACASSTLAGNPSTSTGVSGASPGGTPPGAAGTPPSTSPGSGPDDPISGPPLVIHPSGDGATLVKPDPTVVDLHRQGWDYIKVSADGRRLVVYFWMGVESCYGLGRVDVVWHDGHLGIHLWTGIRPRPIGMVCPDLAQLYKTVIQLDRPAIGGGSH